MFILSDSPPRPPSVVSVTQGLINALIHYKLLEAWSDAALV